MEWVLFLRLLYDMPPDFASTKEISPAAPGWQGNRPCRTAPDIRSGRFLLKQGRLPFPSLSSLAFSSNSAVVTVAFSLFRRSHRMISSLLMSMRAGCSFRCLWNWAMNSESWSSIVRLAVMPRTFTVQYPIGRSAFFLCPDTDGHRYARLSPPSRGPGAVLLSGC